MKEKQSLHKKKEMSFFLHRHLQRVIYIICHFMSFYYSVCQLLLLRQFSLTKSKLETTCLVYFSFGYQLIFFWNRSLSSSSSVNNFFFQLATCAHHSKLIYLLWHSVSCSPLPLCNNSAVSLPFDSHRHPSSTASAHSPP